MTTISLRKMLSARSCVAQSERLELGTTVLDYVDPVKVLRCILIFPSDKGFDFKKLWASGRVNRHTVIVAIEEDKTKIAAIAAMFDDYGVLEYVVLDKSIHRVKLREVLAGRKFDRFQHRHVTPELRHPDVALCPTRPRCLQIRGLYLASAAISGEVTGSMGVVVPHERSPSGSRSTSCCR